MVLAICPFSLLDSNDPSGQTLTSEIDNYERRGRYIEGKMDPPTTPESGLFHPARDSMQVHSETHSGYTSSNEDHFSDAPEGPDAVAEVDNDKRLPTSPPLLPSLPSIPLVLVEKIDERPSHGEVPGTGAFEGRTADARPDVIRIQPLPDLPAAVPGAFSDNPEGEEQEREESKGEVETSRSDVPITIVERVDSTPAHGEIPGTEAFAKRLVDAAPDVIRTATTSPIPTTVVSIVDSDKPLHGEVLGTEAYKMRAADAQPDVVVKWNEEEDKIARRVKSERERIEKLMMNPGRARSVSPGQGPKSVVPVVKGRVDSVSKITLPIGELKGKKEGKEKEINGVEKGGKEDDTVKEQPLRSQSPISSQKCGPPVLVGEPEITLGATIGAGVERAKEETKEVPAEESGVEDAKGQVIDDVNAGKNGKVEEREEDEVAEEEEKEETTAKEDEIRGEEAEDDDGFGDDDFDDFGEVVEGEEFDEFGEFGEAEAFEPPSVEAAPPPAPPQIPVIPVPVLDFERLDDEDTIRRAAAEAMATMFPIDKEKYKSITPISIDDNAFLTERSLSLWNQLSAPPPLQPPNWKMSRIRRLFLVSLGVPVDLDEILPAETKQKKLVLPSVNIARKSIDESAGRRNSRSRSRARRSTSSSRRKSGVIGPEALDMPGARILCSTSDVALWGLTVEELKEHIKKLESITCTASEVLTYWLKKREGAISDKETFETVIESLVGYARKKRQNG
ncbi:hypothetical protein HOY82DRAFT_564763 [Tuber indicum]|nr:hypothetical protein HOY82DRAFT_564763 [Tuber indicum]